MARRKQKQLVREEKIRRQTFSPQATSSAFREQQQALSGSQAILNSMFGGGVGQRVLGDTRPKILNTLQGGDDPFGLIKNQDGGETAGLFLPLRGGRRTL